MKSNKNWSDSGQQTDKSSATSVQSPQMIILFEDELQNMYWTEKELTKAIPKMMKHATSEDLIEALEHQLTLVQEHLLKIELTFDALAKKANAKKSKIVEEIIKEGKEAMDECNEGSMCDEGIILVCQKIKHYEIASYRILCQFAATLELFDITKLLQQILNEKKDADKKLSDIAVSAENMQAEKEKKEQVFKNNP